MKNDLPKCFCGLKADEHLFPARLWKWFPRGKPLFQNTVSAEVRWTEASCSLCVDSILMVSILSSMHVGAILCRKRCRVLGKGPGRPRDRSLFLCVIGTIYVRPRQRRAPPPGGHDQVPHSLHQNELLVVLCDCFCFSQHMYRRMNNKTLLQFLPRLLPHTCQLPNLTSLFKCVPRTTT